MHMSAKLVRRSCPIDVLRNVFKQRRVENDRSHSTGMTKSLGLHGFPIALSSTYTHSNTKMKGHAYKIWGAIARSSPCHATPLYYVYMELFISYCRPSSERILTHGIRACLVSADITCSSVVPLETLHWPLADGSICTKLLTAGFRAKLDLSQKSRTTSENSVEAS